MSDCRLLFSSLTALNTRVARGLTGLQVFRHIGESEAGSYAEVLTGQPPSAYGLDAGKLNCTSRSLFATHIAPDFAHKLSSCLSSKPARSGLSYTLDATILFKAPSG